MVEGRFLEMIQTVFGGEWGLGVESTFTEKCGDLFYRGAAVLNPGV
jgi:hypothetical protein